MAKWIRYFSAYEIPCYPVIDTDSDKHGHDANQAMDSQADIAKSLQKSELGLEHGPRPVVALDYLGAFDSNFESAMDSLFGDEYTRLDAEAKDLFGTSKVLRARWAASELVTRYPEHDSWAELQPLVEAARTSLTNTYA